MSINIYYESTGTGPPLVFAHGVGGNHASWFQQVPFFSRSYRAISFDHRGFGNSRDVKGGADRSRFVQDLENLLDYLQIERAAFVAQSMGGGTCASFAVQNPTRASALVLADTLVGLKLPDNLEREMEIVRKATAGLPQLDRVLSRNFRDRAPELSYLYTEINNFNTGARESITGRLQPVTPGQLAETGIPILFIAGSEDVLFPPAIVRKVHALVPASEYVEVENSGHSLYFEQPQKFNDEVLRFLKAHA